MFKENKCDCMIAFGGGSPMDCAKAVSGRIARREAGSEAPGFPYFKTDSDYLRSTDYGGARI
ncbi:MAG: iron-containing alcohol dehydrogenase [Eisenbergiella sp.]